MVKPPNQSAHWSARCPLIRISYSPGSSYSSVDAGVSLILRLVCFPHKAPFFPAWAVFFHPPENTNECDEASSSQVMIYRLGGWKEKSPLRWQEAQLTWLGRGGVLGVYSLQID